LNKISLNASDFLCIHSSFPQHQASWQIIVGLLLLPGSGTTAAAAAACAKLKPEQPPILT